MTLDARDTLHVMRHWPQRLIRSTFIATTLPSDHL